MKINNGSFYKIRKALEIEAINFYLNYSQTEDKINNTFLYLQNETTAKAVLYYKNK